MSFQTTSTAYSEYKRRTVPPNPLHHSRDSLYNFSELKQANLTLRYVVRKRFPSSFHPSTLERRSSTMAGLLTMAPPMAPGTTSMDSPQQTGNSSSGGSPAPPSHGPSSSSLLFGFLVSFLALFIVSYPFRILMFRFR